MSDVKIFLNSGQDDDQDDDDYSKYYESNMLDQTNPDDLLTPLEKLHKYCTSENIFTRQMVARSIVETVQSVTNEQECFSLLEVITKLSDDVEPSVRCELMEQLPSCCIIISELQLISNAIPEYILPVMVKYLTDNNNQVRKLTQNALLQLMDQMLIQKEDVENQICPIILSLTEPESGDDFRTEAVGLMTKITSVIGGESSEKLFLTRFGDLCADPLFHVRKVCASNFGDVACVLSQETTEASLLPLFSRLCEDGVWGVRKACAETFMSVSITCSNEVRYHTLAPLFVSLLCDKSRWVQMAAYQALGQFISTFAHPKNSGFGIGNEGQLIKVKLKKRSKSSPEPMEDPTSESDRQTSDDTSQIENPLTPHHTKQSDGLNATASLDIETKTTSTDNKYSSFAYWRAPIPPLDVTVDDEIKTPIDKTEIQTNEQDTNINNDNNIQTSEKVNEEKNESITTTNDSYVIIETDNVQSNESADNDKPVDEKPSSENSNTDDTTNTVSSASSSNENSSLNSSSNITAVSEPSNRIVEALRVFVPFDEEDVEDVVDSRNVVIDHEALNAQSIVPPALLEHYVSMIDHTKSQTIDGELPKHCAFTFPGVVLTLGRGNWNCLKETYKSLSSDMQWKVRRTLAFSIHDLALILGEEICVNDLVPVFNAFLKDLDEVRIGVLKHLYEFIDLLPCDLQKKYLPAFGIFLKTDNTRNWRFRQDLAQQLINLVKLYTESELFEHLCPVAIELASDKVAEVRENAYHLLCILMQKLCPTEEAKYTHKFTTSLVTLGTHHQHWVKRKACAQLYLRFLEGQWYETGRFAKDFLPSLLNLCTDDVANVRIVASKAILGFINSEFFQSLPEDDETRKMVDSALEALRADEDRDVRFFSGGICENRLLLNDSSEADNAFSPSGIRLIQRGIHDYALADDGTDDDVELVEEVYMEEQPALGEGEEIVVEEYYVHDDGTGIHTTDVHMQNESGQVFVEEIIEEMIDMIGTNPDLSSDSST